MLQKQLGDIASYINGYAFKPEQRSKVGLPIIRIQDLTGNTYDLGFYDGDYPKKIEINDGDVLISWSASLGVYEWNRGKALLNQHIFKVVFNKLPVNKKFFMYAVQYKLEEMKNKTHGATMKHITKKDFDSITIPFPSMAEQEKISNTLDKLRATISNKESQLKKLDNLIKARFIEMFGAPKSNPFGYRFERLSEVCIINPRKTSEKNLTDDLEISFIPMPNVSDKGEIDTSNIKTYAEVKKGFTYFAENDVLFAKITPCMENSKGCVARNLKNGVGFGSTEFHVLRPKDGIANSYWLYTLTHFKSFRKDAESCMTGSAGQRRTPASFFEKYEVAIPPIDKQKEFEGFIKQVDKSKFAIQKTTISLMNLCRL